MAGGRGAVSWRKSSYSAGTGEACCEVAVLPGAVWVRDTKQSDGALVTFTAEAWRSAIALFLAADAS